MSCPHGHVFYRDCSDPACQRTARTYPTSPKREVLRASVVIATRVLVLHVGPPNHNDPLILATSNRRFGGFTFPGGKVNDRETPRAAAIRELREETNLTATEDHLTYLFHHPNTYENEECEVYVYHARQIVGELQDIEQGTTHRWMTWDELLAASPFAAFYQRWLPDGVKHLRPTIRCSEIVSDADFEVEPFV